MWEEKYNQFMILQKKKNKNVKKIIAPKKFPLNPSMNINKLKKILNRKKII